MINIKKVLTNIVYRYNIDLSENKCMQYLNTEDYKNYNSGGIDMNTNKIEKIQKTSKIALKVTNVAKVICIVAAIIVFVAGIIVLAYSDEVNEAIRQEVESGEVLAEDILEGLNSAKAMELIHENKIATVLTAYMVIVAIMLILVSVVWHFIGKVFKNLTENYSPFNVDIIKDLKIAFILITIISLRSSILFGIVTGLALWCIINIFEYGCILQQQSDETL